MTTTEPTTSRAAALADTLARSFETRTRANGDAFTCCTDAAPQWVRDSVREAHGEQGPSDWTYSVCEDAADYIADAVGTGTEPADLVTSVEVEADAYTADRLRWLASSLDNSTLVDEYVAEFGIDAKGFDIAELIGGAQWMAKDQIHRTMIAAYIAELDSTE